MDWIAIRSKVKELAGKYKYAALILLLGIFLMMLPGGREVQQEQPAQDNPPEESGIGEKLEQILGLIDGVGQVRVLLTEERGAETVFQTDRDSDSSSDSQSLREDTVIISDAQRGEYGLIQQENPPQYLGAIVVCQGGGEPTVRLQVVEAVSSVTGIPSDRITVLKMK